MILKNLKVGWRNILKNKFFSFLNIGGVALGIAVSALILFWVVDELSFDRFHKNIDQIYTVFERQQFSNGQDFFTGCTPFPLSKALKQEYAEVKNATTYSQLGNFLLKSGDKEFKEGPLTIVDEEFMNIFSFNILEGDPDALKNPNQIMITPELARLFFGNEPAIGKVISINEMKEMTVGAIVEAPGRHSSIDFKVLAPLALVKEHARFDYWGNNWPSTAILMSENASVENFGSEIEGLLKEKGQETTSLFLFPFKNERLYSYSNKSNRIQYVYQFLAIALIIILIASINFVNSSTAGSETRRVEVGIRKVLGASKLTLTRQFFSEKGLMIGLSVVLSILLIWIFSPFFVQHSGKTIEFAMLGNRYLMGMLLMVIVLTLVLSAAYPAWYISSFIPARVLKKQSTGGRKKLSLRSTLVVVQFSLSIILIICTISVSTQLKYISNYDLGYAKDNLVYLKLNAESKAKHEALVAEYRNITGVESLTQSNKLPFNGGNSSWDYEWQGKSPDKKLLISRMEVDPQYFKTLGISFKEGETFSGKYSKVQTREDGHYKEVILNAAAIRQMEMSEPIGKYFGRNESQRSSIKGVVNDFHYQTLKVGVRPMVICPLTQDPSFLIMRVQSQNMSQTLAALKSTWNEVTSGATYEIGFFDERLEEMYNSEQSIASLFRYFAIVAIFISCIGLFGLSVYAIERKKKEIGVRKVNGSTIAQVLAMLNKDFVRWVTIAFVIACPVAWFTMNKWLENFAYKTSLSWWIFALSGILALGIALLTVSWQSWRAATQNPVESLRYE